MGTVNVIDAELASPADVAASVPGTEENNNHGEKQRDAE